MMKPNVEKDSQQGNGDKVENVEARSEDMNAAKNLVDGKAGEGKDDENRTGSESDISDEEQKCSRT